MSGKSKLAHLIVQSLSSWAGSGSVLINERDTLLDVSSTMGSCAVPGVCADNFPPLSIVEADMVSFTNHFCNDVSTAIAHCVSADFYMGAGVALSIREKFGRPSKSDCLSHHLSCQKLSSGASVYGLITKPKYFHKPYFKRYNTAFRHFLQDFQKKKFSTLICSPMGCIRDGIPLDIFCKNIVNFQRTTHAQVFIVTSDENPGGILKNGITHQEFVKKLQMSISTASGVTIKAMKHDDVFVATHRFNAIPSASVSRNDYDSVSPADPIGLSSITANNANSLFNDISTNNSSSTLNAADDSSSSPDNDAIYCQSGLNNNSSSEAIAPTHNPPLPCDVSSNPPSAVTDLSSPLAASISIAGSTEVVCVGEAVKSDASPVSDVLHGRCENENEDSFLDAPK